ncbi:PPE family protein [Mycobacterium sp. 1245499.0]|uniref:PPE family protein n=1 Tax=Mycobacterium sp. 1245499.0 TaxID=1834074 RepID=UPI00350F3972
MDFGALPPESNSGRMHSGPGAGSMMDAAKAWGVLGAQLADMALTYRAVIAELEPGGQSASTTPITQAVAPYLAWLDATAAQARQTASQATAAAAAYGLALAAVVSPHAIDANRLRRISLAAANCLGQLSPAVADADADYERMWAQDAAAMYAYARASAGVWKLTPFDSPPPAADPGEHMTAALHSAAALLRELRCLSAKSTGADNELNLDSGAVADNRDVSKVASGEVDSAPSASEMVEITCRPVVMTSGATVRVQLRDGGVTPTGSPGSAAGGGESNGCGRRMPRPCMPTPARRPASGS